MWRTGAVSVSWALLLPLLCIVLVCSPSNGVVAQEEEQNASCANPREVISFGPTTEDSEKNDVKIDGESFRVTYDVEVLRPGDFAFLTIDVSGRFGEGPLVFVEKSEGDSFVSTDSPGTFDATVAVDEPNSARYTLTIEDCGGGDDNGPDDAQYDDEDGDAAAGEGPDDVVPGTETDKPLPNTGGLPVLLGAAALALSAALVLRRTLVP